MLKLLFRVQRSCFVEVSTALLPEPRDGSGEISDNYLA